METIKELSKENLKKNGLFAALIFLIVAILAAAFVAINLLYGVLVLVVIPFIVLPIFFSFERALIIIREQNVPLSFTLIFEGFKLYFNERFNSTFNVVKTLIWGLLVYFGSGIIFGLTINLSFYYSNYLGWGDTINELMKLFSQTTTIEVFDNFIKEHQEVFSLVDLYSSIPVLGVTAIYAFTSFTINSNSIFLRFSSLNYPGQYLKLIFADFIKRNRKAFLGNFLKLNFPLYILFIGGMALGGYLGSLYKVDTAIIFTFALMMGLFLSFGIYGSIYFANKEALYTFFIKEYQQSDSNIKNSISQMLQNQIKELQEQKAYYERKEAELKQRLDDEDSNNEEEPKE